MRVRTLALCLAILVQQGFLAAMSPPQPGTIETYRKDGSLGKRQAFAREIGNHRADPALVQDARNRLLRLAAPSARPVQPAPPPVWKGLPTKGSPKMFVLMIDFSDYPADPVNSVAAVTARVFGSGDGVQPAPYESLNSYYARASYGQLSIAGTVFATYHAGARSSIPTTTAGRQALIKNALLWVQSQYSAHDFSQYDNNNSGQIDFFTVLWTGPDTGWSNFWWAYQTSWSSSTTPFTIGGKTLKKYVWQWVANAGYPTRNAPNFDPKTLIHETGHALGLPDYYDYDPTSGPKGGVGRLDMMDGNWGDHNCFSKFLLDWITPAVVTTTTPNVSLVPSGTNKDNSSIIVINTSPGGTFGEYFMVQNRQRVGNDPSSYPADGLLIWHVDSQLDPATGNTDYLYDNSYTEHKLLKLMEADGLEEIEASDNSVVNAGDFYQTGAVFGPSSNPTDLLYTGVSPWLEVRNIVTGASSMSFNVVGLTPDTTPPTGVPTQPTGAFLLDALTLQWALGTAADSESSITGYYLQVGSTPGAADVFDGRVGKALTKTLTGLARFEGRPLYARVRAMNGGGLYTAWSPDSTGIVLSLPIVPASALDNLQLTFKTVGPWSVDASTVAQFGGSSARSAVITDSSATSLQTWVQGPGTFSFYWKVSSEPSYDYLHFYVDGVEQAAPISGEVAWTQVTCAIPSGAHFLQWVYLKDEAVSAGLDSAWVDHVAWDGGVPTLTSVDTNQDTVVDLRDLLYLGKCYGTVNPACNLDGSGDGLVTDADLSILLGVL